MTSSHCCGEICVPVEELADVQSVQVAVVLRERGS
jgi:hypothetical protein